MGRTKSKLLVTGLGVGGGIVALALFFAIGPPDLYGKSESPEFCGGACHPMAANHQAWFHSGPHRQIKCVDCHLPNDSKARHLLQKSRDGIHDARVFYTGQVPDVIELSEHGQEVVQANCTRCHGDMTAEIDEERACWHCHRGLSHGYGGSVEARAP